MTEESFTGLIRSCIARYGSAQALADAIGMSLSALARAVRNPGAFDVEQCLRLADKTGERPSRVLRIAGKGQVADLIERLYDVAKSSAAEQERSVTWEEVQPIAEESFGIWVGSSEIHWAERAWAHLTTAQLTSARTTLDRLTSYVRFLVLASLYRDWCAIVWDEVHDDEPDSWLSEVEVDRTLVAQLLGPDCDLSDDDDENDFTDALVTLMEREHRPVVYALLQGFDGVEGLFLALWRSRRDPEEERRFDDEDEDYCDDWAESDADILNDVTPQKAAGYQWIREGCETQGPVRSTAEIDN